MKPGASDVRGENQQLSGPAREAAREAVRYMQERNRAASRGEAVPPLPCVANAGKGIPRAPVFGVPPCQTLGRRFLAARYREWWVRNLPSPYGVCACGCGGRTPRAGWTSRERGFVSGEPLAFLAHHRKRFGYPALTDPGRRCACGCGGRPPVVRDTAVDEAGVPYQFAGMRAKYLSAGHRPPPDLPYLTLTTPLGSFKALPGEAEPPEKERGWLASLMDAHGSFARDRGKLRPKLQSTDGEAIQEFLEVSGRGRIDVSQPTREGASPVWKWTGRSPLEAGNVLHGLYGLLLPETRKSAERFLKEMEFPVPGLEEVSFGYAGGG